jgi:pimeloyl-ACP methyl ester carboxylesterase
VGKVVRLSKLVIASLLLLGASCSSKPKPGKLAPLTASSWRVALDVPGFGAASLAVPLGATAPRPIVVVLHGQHDEAEWQCGSFRGVVGGSVFVLCPSGQAQGGQHGWGSVDETAAELRAGLGALKRRFGGHVAKGAIALIGYGAGGEVAAELARQEPSFFARLALVEGDPSAFSPTASKIFAERGGKRVLFFCTSSACDDRGAERATLLGRRGVAAKSVKRDVGPYLDKLYTDALKGEITWLLEGDARFARPRH